MTANVFEMAAFIEENFRLGPERGTEEAEQRWPTATPADWIRAKEIVVRRHEVETARTATALRGDFSDLDFGEATDTVSAIATWLFQNPGPPVDDREDEVRQRWPNATDKEVWSGMILAYAALETVQKEAELRARGIANEP